MMKLEEAVALVTGGASGIGKAICEQLLINKAKVCILDIDAEAGEATLKEFSSRFPEDHIIFALCDVTNRQSLSSAFNKAKTTFGWIDIVCNNAGLLDDRNWERAVQVNLIGVMNGVEVALDLMGQQNGGQGGVIINTSSIAGIYVFPAFPAYAAAKAGVNMLTVSLAETSWPEQGIRINAVCPSGVDTPLRQECVGKGRISAERIKEALDKERLQGAEDVAEAVCSLIADDSKNGVLLQVAQAGNEKIKIPPLPTKFFKA